MTAASGKSNGEESAAAAAAAAVEEAVMVRVSSRSRKQRLVITLS